LYRWGNRLRRKISYLKMKKIIFGLIVWVLACSTAQAYDYSADAVGAWLFTTADYNGGAGTTVDDASPNSNTGTFASSGHPAWSSTVPGAFSDYSVYRPDDFTYITLASAVTIPSASDFSFMVWIRTDATGIGREIIGRTSNTSQIFRINQLSNNTVQFMFRDDASGGLTYLASTSTLSVDTWYHICCVRDESANSLTVYWNGDSDKTGSDADWGQIASTLEFFRDGADSANSFPGYLDEIGIFTYALTSTEINDIRDHGLKPAAAATYSGQVIVIED
jgi:hypothetical protein